MKKIINILYAACLVVMISSCGDDQNSPAVIQYSGDVEGLFTEGRVNGVNLYYDALVKTGLNSRLSESTERTFLVPNNAAMQAALQSGGFLTVAAADVDFLTELVNDHTFSGIIVEDDFAKGILTTESGKQVYVSVGSGISFNSKASVSEANLYGANGIVHVINFPILDFPENNIATIVSNAAGDATTPEFTTLNAALAATGLDATLGGSTEYTVFAPTDAAFAVVGLNAGNVAGALTAEALTELLLNHVVAGRFFTLDLASGRTYTANGGAGTAKGLDIEVGDGSVSIEIDFGITADGEGANVNLLATNGVVHIVDEVIYTEAYVYEALGDIVTIGDPSNVQGFFADYFNALAASSFDYEALLSSEDEYSVMAPTGYSGGSTQAELDSYIFEGTISLEDAVGSRVTSIGDDSYFVGSTESLDSDRIVIYGATGSVMLAGSCSGDACIQDAETYNGNVTLLSGTTLTPLPSTSTTSVVEAATDTLDYFTASLAFLELDSLVDVTYLGVQNSDFESVLRDALTEGGVVDPDTIADADLIANIESADAATLSAVVDQHIVTSLFFALDLVADVQLSNRAGQTLDIVSVTADGETEFGILVNDDGDISTISFVTTDVTGSNGAFHTLSSPLPEQ